MNFIKCHTITDAPPVTLGGCPAIILTADGGLYADVTISGKPTRLRFSDIISVSALPAAPQANRLYALRNTLMYAYNDSWITLATTVDVNTITAQVHELISAESQARNEAISEAVTSINSSLESKHEVLRQEINKEVATAKDEAIADAEARNTELHTTITGEIATAKAEVESVAAADATAKANAAQSAAEGTAAAALARTEAKLSKEGEVPFTAEATIRGAISAVEQALEELRSELPEGGAGSGESTCNFTPELAEKLAGIESEAQKNVIEGIVIDGVTIEPENKLVTLATVATTGDYADLQNRPTDLGEFTNTPGYLTADDLPTTQPGPTKLSELENDTGFITSSSSITGNAATADKLSTARTITISGAVAGSVQFDGSSDVTLTVTLGDDIKIDASDITGLTVDYADIKNTPEVYTKTEIDNLIGDLETELDEI